MARTSTNPKTLFHANSKGSGCGPGNSGTLYEHSTPEHQLTVRTFYLYLILGDFMPSEDILGHILRLFSYQPSFPHSAEPVCNQGKFASAMTTQVRFHLSVHHFLLTTAPLDLSSRFRFDPQGSQLALTHYLLTFHSVRCPTIAWNRQLGLLPC